MGSRAIEQSVGAARLVAVIEHAEGCEQVYTNGRRCRSPLSADAVFAEIEQREGNEDWCVLSVASEPERAVYLRRSEYEYCRQFSEGRTAVVLTGCYVEVFEDEAGVEIEIGDSLRNCV